MDPISQLVVEFHGKAVDHFHRECIPNGGMVTTQVLVKVQRIVHISMLCIDFVTFEQSLQYIGFFNFMREWSDWIG